MKKRNHHQILAVSLLLTILSFTASAQKADSVRVEQAGDFVKVFYKINGSNPNQTFRISLLASINGGLRSELRSVSGDIGENIVGGKSEYWILWDVLKDVEELTSVEFFIKSEPMRNLAESSTDERQSATIKWQKKRFTIMPAITGPGPRIGAMVGVNGSFGVLAAFSYGKIAEPEAQMVLIGGSIESFGKDGPQFSINLTKRLVSIESFQLHLAAGFTLAEMEYAVADLLVGSIRYDEVMTRGLSAGLLLGAGRMTGSVMYMNYDPGSVEKQQDNYRLITPMGLFTIGLGVRF